VVAADDFGGLGRLVDVGGGYSILHDWADDDARRLLATCRSARP
jgi:hypothetical protein